MPRATDERLRIGRERPRRAAEHVARELVEHYDERQRRERPLRPAVEPAGGGRVEGREEPLAAQAVEGVRLLEPLPPVAAEFG
jgi:hypothetical protein